jgi:glycosyltransferase involved in cell wall biosynthesis
MNDASIAVLIPCYNEAPTVEKVVRDFRRALPQATVYVYDNNSTDGTDEIARRAGAVVRYEKAQGKGNVIRSMFRDIDADCYVMADGDDTYPAESAPEMAELILSGQADMVIGDRLSSNYFTENGRAFHGFGNKLVRFLVNLLCRGDLHDVMSGLRAFSRSFVKDFPVYSDGFQVETEMAIYSLKKGRVIREIPVPYRERPAGSVSKLNTVKDGFRVLAAVAKMTARYR